MAMTSMMLSRITTWKNVPRLYARLSAPRLFNTSVTRLKEKNEGDDNGPIRFSTSPAANFDYVKTQTNVEGKQSARKNWKFVIVINTGLFVMLIWAMFFDESRIDWESMTKKPGEN